jgi:hypothetical protein
MTMKVTRVATEVAAFFCFEPRRSRSASPPDWRHALAFCLCTGEAE